MKDLIDRQAAIDAIEPTIKSILQGNSFKAINVMDKIRNLPSAQPEPITAYWKKDIFGAVFCSQCGGIRRDNRVGHVQWCNSCGCFMRGEENE